MTKTSLAEILLASRPELAAHLEQQAEQMRTKKRDSNPERQNRPGRHLATVTR